jgi:hypothetical protein
LHDRVGLEGRRYLELDTGLVGLSLNNRDALAKTTGLPADGDGSHRLLIATDAGGGSA